MNIINVIRRTAHVTVLRQAVTVTVPRYQKIVRISTGVVSRTPSFVSFYLVATEGQTTFSLPGIPDFLLAVYVNGVSQSVVKGDYTSSMNQIVFSSSLNAGDGVAGVYVKF
jgi:hypothetical protein